MKKITVLADQGRLTIPSEYNKLTLRQWVKDGIQYFDLIPRIRGTRKQQKYLEGAIIPSWGNFQYGLDPRDPTKHELARTLFKQDFNYQILKDVKGNPRRVAVSLQGKHREALDRYVSAASENGFPIPNEDLYKVWSDQYSMDLAWSNYWDWLDFVGLEVDAMPSSNTLKEIAEKTK